MFNDTDYEDISVETVTPPGDSTPITESINNSHNPNTRK